MKFCPECGTPCEGANFCPGCGKDLRPYNQSTPQVATPTKPPMVTGQAKPAVQYDIETALAPFICCARGDEAYMITGVKDTNITKAVIPNCVTMLGTKAFFACQNLVEVHLPSSLEDTGYLAFAKCEALKTVVIEQGVRKIEEGSFGKCVALEDIQIPEGVCVIGARAFQGSGLKTIQLPRTVTTIENNAFADCVHLTYAKVPEHLVVAFKAQCPPTCTVIPY